MRSAIKKGKKKKVIMIDSRHNVILASYTVYKIGGPARFFVEVKNESELKEAIDFATKNHAAIFVLGAGSNILVSDKGFDGLVMHFKNNCIEISGDEVTADAGVMMARVALESARAGLSGFEWGAGVPGTIGGSVRGNAGCYGGEMKDAVDSVEVLDALHAKCFTLSAGECGFDYRESIFKKHLEWIIISAVLKLKKADPDEALVLLEAVKQKGLERLKEQPIGEPSAGSVFKGVAMSKEVMDKLGRKIPWWYKGHENSSWMFENRRGFISAGFFIEMAGLKGRRIGGAMISSKHANFIVNLGSAKAEDVMMLISIAKDVVMRKFGIALEEEIQLVGF